MIAFFIQSLRLGGAERVLVNLVNDMARQGHDVDLVLTRVEGSLLSQVDPAVQIVDLGTRRARYSLLALARYLRRRRPEALVTSLTNANVLGPPARALARVPVRLVAWEHTTLSRYFPTTSFASRALGPRVVRATYPHVDVVVAVSQGVADDLARLLHPRRADIVVLANPVVGPDMTTMASQTAHAWLASPDGPLVVTAGRLAPPKDHATLLHAFAAVARHRPARLAVLGEGEQQAELVAMARRLGVGDQVLFLGGDPNPYPWLRAADVVVLASRREGLPTVLVEALALGTPVVATDCDHGPRELLAGGRHGSLVPVGDDGALAAALLGAIEGRAPAPALEAWEPYTLAAAVPHFVTVLRSG